MTFLALVLAFVAEQIRPLPRADRVREALHAAFSALLWRLPVAGSAMAAVVWSLLVLGGGLLAWGAYEQLARWDAFAAFLFNVVVLYGLLGFRYHERMYSDIHLALSTGRLTDARVGLEQWRGTQHEKAGASELSRLSIEHGLVSAHRSLFAPIFWFVLLPGPAGVVIYRLAVQLATDASLSRQMGGASVEAFAGRMLELMEWLPTRLTATALSVAGNFEDAIACWRTQARLWPEPGTGVLLAAGAGALGVRLGLSVHAGAKTLDRPEMGLGAQADIHAMRRAARMAWRVMVLYMVTVALLGVAIWAGGG